MPDRGSGASLYRYLRGSRISAVDLCGLDVPLPLRVGVGGVVGQREGQGEHGVRLPGEVHIHWKEGKTQEELGTRFFASRLVATYCALQNSPRR